MSLQHDHAEPQGPFGIRGMVRLALFSFQIAKPVLPPAKNHAFSQSIRLYLPVKTTGISWRLGQTVAPVQSPLSLSTFHNPTRLRRGERTGEQSALPFLNRGSGGWVLCDLASSSKHPTCASVSCKCIHWHPRLPAECCKRQLPSGLAA